MHCVHKFLVGEECLIDLVKWNDAVIVRWNVSGLGRRDLWLCAAIFAPLLATLAALLGAADVFSFPRSCVGEGGLAAWGSVRSR